VRRGPYNVIRDPCNVIRVQFNAMMGACNLTRGGSI